MKRYIPIIFVLMICFILTGCFSGHIHYTFNKDGSGDVSVKLAMNSLLSGLTELGEDPFKDLAADSEKKGFTISRFKEDDLQGIEVKKHYNDYRKMLEEDSFFDSDPKDKSREITVKKGFFADTYRFETNLDMSGFTNEFANEIGKALFSQADFDLIITLPIKADKNNASNVSADGKTYTWNLRVGDQNKIVLQARKVNGWNVFITVAGAVTIIVLAAFFTVLYFRNKQTA